MNDAKGEKKSCRDGGSCCEKSKRNGRISGHHKIHHSDVCSYVLQPGMWNPEMSQTMTP
jgi:hypothetical protein